MLMRSGLFVAIGLLVGFSFISARADDNKLSSKDQKFVQEAADGGQMEVDLGKLAADKATNDDVKKFGQKMVDDHSKANDQLKSIATSKGMDVTPKTDESQKRQDRLNKETGDAFDKLYVKMMVRDHEKTVKLFEDEAKDGDDADLKKFASDTLPTLQDHLKMIQDIQGKIGK